MKEVLVNVIGLGYIGLPTAMMMAAHGVNVVGTDYNENLVNKLQNGEMTFEEDGIDELFAEANKKGIKFTTKVSKSRNLYYLCANTV